jgi:hypothetical protein
MLGQGGSYELCIHNGTPEGGDDGVARVVGFSFRTDALVDEDIASEGTGESPSPAISMFF